MNFIIENDEFFKHYLAENAKNNDVINSLSVVDQIKKLTDGVNVLNNELQNQINVKHKDLLSQASCSNTLEVELGTIQTHVQQLYLGAKTIQQTITLPFESLNENIKILERVHSACHILRYVQLMQQWLNDLDRTTDQVQQAKIINNLSDLIQEPLLSDVEIISANIRHVHLKRQELLNLAKSQLKKSVTSENKAQIKTFIHILSNLRMLNKEIEDLVAGMIADTSSNIKTVLSQAMIDEGSTKIKGGPGGASLSNSGNVLKEKLWNGLEGIFGDKIYQQCRQINLLDNLLMDLNNSSQYESFSMNFWNKITETVINDMKNSPVIYQNIFEEDYPRILKMYCDLVRKLNSKQYATRHSTMTAWENVYLSKSLSKLLDKVTEMFSDPTTCPSQESIDAVIRIISNDLSVALIEESLSESIAKNIAKCTRSFGLKSENVILTTPETAHSIGLTNASQQFNIKLANSSLYFKTQLNRMLVNMAAMLSPNTVQIVQNSLTNLDQVMTMILSPLVDSINSAIETIIITIHNEQDWGRVPVRTGVVNCSPYMRELIEYIARAYRVHLSPFHASEPFTVCCAKIAVRCIDLFVRHSSLVRPISEGGRIRLQADYREIEQALCILCPQLQTLGQPYRLLKSMGILIALPPQEIIETQLVGSSVAHSTVLLMLFSYASPDLQSPHTSANWTIERLSKWLDEHADERSRMELISGALQNYLAKVRKNNITTFDPVYVLMETLIKQFYK